MIEITKIKALIFMLLLIGCHNTTVEKGLTKGDNVNADSNSKTQAISHKYSSDSIAYLISTANDEKCWIDHIEGFYIPMDLKDSHLVLDTMLNDSTKTFIKNGGEGHFGLGMYLRNNWGLWSRGRLKCYFEHQGINHPDHMSGMIIYTYSLKLNNTQINEDRIIKEALEELKQWEDEMQE